MYRFLLSDFLLDSVDKYPDKTALCFGEDTYSYQQIYEGSRNLAGYFAKNGVKRGDRIIIYLENSPEVVITMFAALFAGGVFSVVNHTIKKSKFKYIVENCSPAFIISDNSKLEMLKEIKSDINIPSVLSIDGSADSGNSFQDILKTDAELPDLKLIDLDLAAIIYTSGSTGDPKGVTLTHRNMVSAAQSITTYLENSPSDIVLCVLPLSFDYGLYQVLMSFLFSGTIVLEKKFGFPFALVNLIKSREITGLPCVPTMMAIFLQLKKLKDNPISCVKYITNTGAALPPAYIPRLKRIFPNARIYSMYGLTECKRVSYLPPDMADKKPDSVGLAMPNTEVFVADDEGTYRSSDAEGELVIRGSNIMREYWNDPEGTAEVIKKGRYPGERLLYSGDLFRIDRDGYLYFKGRKDDIIKSRGERISPKEIENVIYQLKEVSAVRVFAVPDDILGNAIKAEIVVRPGVELTIDNIYKHCREHLEDLMVPKYLEIVDNLPVSESGKILKK